MPRPIRPASPLTLGISALVVWISVCATPGTARAAAPTDSPASLEKACANRDAKSCLALGLLYEQGKGGVPRNEIHAAYLYERACENGSPRGCDKLAALKDEGSLNQEGGGVRKDEQRAAGWYEKSCTEGDPTACTHLGGLYLQGIGVMVDEGRAAGLFRRACEGGDATACSRLGTLHTQGRGVVKSPQLAALFFQKACTLGDASRCPDPSSEGSTSAPQTVSARQEEPLPDLGRRLHLLLTLGGQAGEEKLLEVDYSDGDTDSIELGSGLVLATGAVLEPFGGTTHIPQLQATIGLTYEALPHASNANASLMQWPLELLAFYSYRPLNLRIGGGIQYNLGVQLEGTGGLAPATTSFTNALGFVVQGEVRFADVVSLYFRHTRIEYRPVGTWTRLPGHSFGIGMSFFLRAL